jgi:hypothetical protein
MRIVTVVVGSLMLLGAGPALAHDHAQESGNGHDGCCCQHGQHHAKAAKAQPPSDKTAKPTDQTAPKADQKSAPPADKK